MGVLGERNKQVMFVVDASAALSGIFTHLLTDYIVPCIECFNGGPISVQQLTSPSALCYYGVITIRPTAIFSVPTCNYSPITSKPETLLQSLKSIQFEGGIIEHCCRISEGLAAALEYFEIGKLGMDRGGSQSADSETEKYCILITNLPPSQMPVMESITYGTMTHSQLAVELAKKNVHLSIIAPRWLPPYLDLFMKAATMPPYDSTAISKADHSLHAGFMVLLRGLEVPSLRAQKIKSEADATENIMEPLSVSQPPSVTGPSHHSETSSNPGSIPGAVAMISSTESTSFPPPTIRKTTSVSSLLDVQPHSYPGLHQLSPKQHTSPGNPASVGSVPSSFSTSGGSVPDIVDMKSLMTSTSSGPPQTLNSNPRNVVAPSDVKSYFPSAATISDGGGLLDVAPVGSSTNPIQITSPGVEIKPSFPTSSAHLPPASSTASLPISSVAGILPPSSAPSLSSLLLPNSSDPASFNNSFPPSISVSATPMQSTTMLPLPSNSMLPGVVSSAPPTSIPTGAELMAQRILMEAAQQAKNGTNQSVNQPMGGVTRPYGTNIPSVGMTPPTTTLAAGVMSTNNTVGGIQQPQQQLGGVSMAMPQPPPGLGMGGQASNMGAVQGAIGQNPIPPPGQVPIPPQNQMSKIWSGYLETYEMRGNQKIPRQVQCNMLVSKPETTPDIKPDLWPSKIIMAVYPKLIFDFTSQNAINVHIRINQTTIRTVQFQFMEPPQNVAMLRSLISGDVQNKKVAIVQLPVVQSASPCPIRAFFMVWNEKTRQFMGLIPLEQEKLIAALKQVLTQPKQFSQLQQQQQQMSGMPGSTATGGGPQSFASMGVHQPNMISSSGNIGGVGTGGQQMFMANQPQQPQQVSSMMGGQGGGNTMTQTVPAGAPNTQFGVPPQPQQRMLGQMNSGGLQQASSGGNIMLPSASTAGGSVVGGVAPGHMTTQQTMLNATLQSNEKFRQIFENATPEQKQILLSKLERHQQQQQQPQFPQQQFPQQQPQQFPPNASAPMGSYSNPMAQQMMQRGPPMQQQQQMVRPPGGTMAPPQQQFQPQGGSATGGLDLFQL